MAIPSEDKADDEAVPGYRNYRVYSDESGIHGSTHYGFGTLWMPHERRGDFAALIEELRNDHQCGSEVKWNKVQRDSLSFHLALLDAFFKSKWLMFHCLIVRKAMVDLSLHADLDEARRKHFAMLVKRKVQYFCGNAADKAYHFRIDPFPSRYKKADEVAFKIAAAQLTQELGLSPLKSLYTRDSKTTVGIQLADFLLGAAMADWQKDANSYAKEKIRTALAGYLGWKDMRADTQVSEWKFNMWYFYDPRSGKKREATSRDVVLKYPLPPFRPRR